ncbi:MAG: FAD-binding oxidoreductase, partial [Crocosphaera sp.]
MNNFDFIVVGGGITGSVLSYELAQKGLKVLLLEKDPDYDNATRYSYGGIAYWSGTDDLSRKLCQESREIYHNLSEELDAETEFRELDLMLTISSQNNPNLVADSYEKFAIQPQLLTPQEACEIEPLLNTEAISGVLKLPHGHIHPQKTNDAYQQAFSRLGGEIKYEQVNQLISHNNILEGVRTNREQYYAKNTVICAGGLS